MKNILHTFFICLFLSGSSYLLRAQHPLNLEPLTTNPRLAEEHQFTPRNLFPEGGNVFYFMDTLSLPVVDDFSRDRFKDFRLYQYSGVYEESLYYFRTQNYVEQYPDSVWYVLNQPDTFQITGDSTFITFPCVAPQFKIFIYDTITNPFRVADSILAWRFIPQVSSVVNFNPIFSADIVPDGKLYNRLKSYTIVPTSPNDKSVWTDRNVYVSNTMAVEPPTVGVAVFDGIRRDGMPYASNESAYGIADYLTSKPINLSGYLPGDSIYLSFYVQPQGLGFFPEPKDSLVLEFKSPQNTNWERKWSSVGSPLTPFRHIRIPVLDAEYFVKGFQFRFKNYAGLAANMDHWLLDYVRLDANRSVSDTLFNDVAFVTPPPTILNRYEQMPAKQFIQAEVNQKWKMESTNLWNQCKWITYGHTLFSPSGDSLTSYPYDALPGSYDTSCVNPFYPNREWNNNFRHFLPEFSYLFDVFDPLCCPYTDSMQFTVRHIIKNLTGENGTLTHDLNTGNDTVVRKQSFFNYFAYDDGEAEGAFFLGTVGQIAYEFEMNFADTLRAVQFYFNPQKPNVSNNNFELRVWGTLQNTSEDTLYSQSFVQPVYNNTGPNQFTTYILDRPVFLPQGKFYVGWRQNTQFKMNVGFDKNKDNSEKIFYKTTGEWIPFSDIPGYEGSFMIRPVVGAPVNPEDFLDMEEPQETAVTEVVVFPNPSDGFFQYQVTGMAPDDLVIRISDFSGKIIQTVTASAEGQINLQNQPAGLYFVTFHSEKEAFFSSQKIIITR